MKNRLLNMILLCICVVLAVICCVLTITRHNESPDIQSEDVELVYQEGMSDEDLLKGLTAYDKEDGELTDKILIDAKRTSDQGVTVTYIVWDSQHESAVYTREYETVSGQGDLQESQTPSAGEDGQEESEAGTSGEEVSESTVSGEENSSQSELPLESEEAPVPVNPEAPVLALSSSSAVIAAGSSFRYWDYIGTLEDDKDDSEYLSSQIVLDGTYDVNVPGTYELVFWLMDSDGNSSARQTFVLTVQ